MLIMKGPFLDVLAYENGGVCLIRGHALLKKSVILKDLIQRKRNADGENAKDDKINSKYKPRSHNI